MKIEPTTIEPTAQQLTSAQTRMLRRASSATGSSPPGGGACAAPAGRSGSSTNRQIRKARISPGMPARKNAVFQSYQVAIRTRIQEASAVPTIGPNTFCTTPALSACRCGAEAAAMIARQIGRNGPSAAPITTRAASSVSKLRAKPESTEQTENSSSAPIRNGLRRPITSDQRPIR